MTAGQDEARAREIIRQAKSITSGFMVNDNLVRLITAALTEARDQGARERQYAHDLAAAMAAKFYPEAAQWKPLDDLWGLLSQIDNMTTGLVRAPPPALAPPREAVAEAQREVTEAVWRLWEHNAPLPAEISHAVARLDAALSRAQPPTTEDLT